MTLTKEKKKEIGSQLESVIDLAEIAEEIVDTIGDVCTPDEVFKEEILVEWAENNGFTRH